MSGLSLYDAISRYEEEFMVPVPVRELMVLIPVRGLHGAMPFANTGIDITVLIPVK